MCSFFISMLYYFYAFSLLQYQTCLPFVITFLTRADSTWADNSPKVVSTNGCWCQVNANKSPLIGVQWRRKPLSAVLHRGYETVAMGQLWGTRLESSAPWSALCFAGCWSLLAPMVCPMAPLPHCPTLTRPDCYFRSSWGKPVFGGKCTLNFSIIKKIGY